MSLIKCVKNGYVEVEVRKYGADVNSSDDCGLTVMCKLATTW